MAYLDYIIHTSHISVLYLFLKIFLLSIPFFVLFILLQYAILKHCRIKTFAVAAALYYIAFLYVFLSYANKHVAETSYSNGYIKSSVLNERILELTGLIKSYPGDYAHYVSRGKLYANNFKYDEALPDFQKALSLNPNLPYANNYICNIYIKKNRLAEAKPYCLKAIEQSSNFSKPHKNLGWLYLEQKDYQKAVSELTLALNIDPNLTQAVNFRGWAYYNLSDYENALADFKKAIDLKDPDSDNLKKMIPRLEAKLLKTKKINEKKY